MDIKEILSKVDHTVLSQGATWDDIKNLCDDGMRYSCASVCIPPSYVKKAKDYVGDNLKTVQMKSIWLSTSVCLRIKDTMMFSKK